MNSEIEKGILSAVENCDTSKYPNICKKKRFEDGKKLIVNMVYARLDNFPTWSVSSALSDVEFNLMGLDNE